MVTLLPQQERMVAAAQLLRRVGWMPVGVGAGKTLSALTLCLRDGDKMLVTAPLPVLEATWVMERDKWGLDLPMHLLWHRSKAGKGYAILRFREAKAPCVGLLNYESFTRLWEQLLDCGVTRLVADESQRCKSHQSAVSKALYKFSKQVPKIVLMSGTPALNHQMEWYPQIRAIGDDVLGSSWWGHMSRYFHKAGYQGHEWRAYPERQAEMMERISRVTIHIPRDEQTLPPVTITHREVELEPEQRRLYEQIKREKMAMIGDVPVLAGTMLTEIMKLRQVTAGFVNAEDEKAKPVGKTKLTELRNVLDEIGADSALIYVQYHVEGDAVMEMLGDKARRLDGTVSVAEKNEAIRAFNAGECQYLVAHPKTAAAGLNLQSSCHYVIWMSLSYSADDWVQGNGRVHRQGQEKPVTVIVIEAKDTIDGAIRVCLEKKQRVSDHLLALMRAA